MPLSKVFVRFPLISQGIVAGSFEASAEIFSQKIIEKKEGFDHRRVFISAFVGYFGGMVMRKWFGYLYETFQGPKPFANAVGKLAADQFLFMPLYIASSTSLTKYLETGSWRDTEALLFQKLAGFVIQDLQLWPAVQFLNFMFIPLIYQAPVNSAITAAWIVFNNYKLQEIEKDRI